MKTQRIEVETYYPEKKLDSNWLLIGKESVGKTAFIESLVGKKSTSSNLQGSSLFCQSYDWNAQTIIDTPGIQTRMDSVITSQVLKRLHTSKQVILMVKSTDLLSDLTDLWPLIQGRVGIIVVTYWDKVRHRPDVCQEIARLKSVTQLQWITVDNRRVLPDQLLELATALKGANKFPNQPPHLTANWSVIPRRAFFELPLIGPLLCFMLLVLPAWVSVVNANALADWLYPFVESGANWLKTRTGTLPDVLNHMLLGDYGVVSMLPFLLLYALPTVLVFSAIIALYKTTGLVDRLSFSLDPFMQKLGLSGRDLVRVIMGFGCNVPAIIQTRHCSCCTRGTCVSAISFGSACSYQLPATIAVFSAAGKPYLVLPYLAVLAATTCLYLLLTTSKSQRRAAVSANLLNRGFLQPPNLQFAISEMLGVIKEFFTTAFPLFIGICLAAGFLSWLGFFGFLTEVIAPLMALVNLPEGAAIAVILGAVRKDGLAIGLIDSASQSLKVFGMSDVQLLSAVYLAGVMLPCIVSLLTIVREMRWHFAIKMALRQMTCAIAFTAVLSWGWG
ncbi:nucleoside recognition domain-containing protein [Pseudoalteromonas sp. MMG012]|uniref:nucleoside recognition domain-containing protein n=1 Tax=Pseudoalteromonas sp. MMG012 TaxID=2822686 RepID=UPI001B39E363|nr:nucleoside recognition domain-containing protein [Pseudoalteromonas sp. MMG012]MBQ4852183.1 50S ribosome-binding GTPase [Pseudoalteromonas sp. MMG012]